MFLRLDVCVCMFMHGPQKDFYAATGCQPALLDAFLLSGPPFIPSSFSPPFFAASPPFLPIAPSPRHSPTPMAPSPATFPKLTNRNYQQWRLDMEARLRTLGAMRIVQGTESRPSFTPPLDSGEPLTLTLTLTRSVHCRGASVALSMDMANATGVIWGDEHTQEVAQASRWLYPTARMVDRKSVV